MLAFITGIIFLLIAIFLIKLSWNLWKIGFILILFLLFLFTCGVMVIDAHEYSPADIVTIGKVVHHEAPYESELGKRLVIDTILNRVESPSFPNSVLEVINQPGQYCNPSKFPPKETYNLVAEEIYLRTNPDVLWYRTKKYHKYGRPIIKEGAHYFSGR